MEQASRLANAQQPAVDDAGEALRRLRIYPWAAGYYGPLIEDLGTYHVCLLQKNMSLSHLRIDRARIKPIEGQVPTEGGNADVEAAMLVSVPPSSSSKQDDEEVVAVKKLRFDEGTDDGRALAVDTRLPFVDVDIDPI